jgi:hypothetical protein
MRLAGCQQDDPDGIAARRGLLTYQVAKSQREKGKEADQMFASWNQILAWAVSAWVDTLCPTSIASTSSADGSIRTHS